MSMLVQKKGRKEPPESKKRELEELVNLIKSKKYVIFADLESMPTKQLQLIKKELRSESIFKVSKKRLILMALEKVGLEKEKVEPYLKNGVLIILTDTNPFKISIKIDKLRIPAPAKAGQPSPKEIVVPEGDTGIRPGPMVSVFGKLKIPYEVRKGTIYIKSDTVVAKKGDIISQELASLLQQLGIQPFEIVLNLILAWDGKTIIPKDVLHVDLESLKSDLITAEKEAIGLATEAAYLDVPEALNSILITAEKEAIGLIQESGLTLDKETAELTLQKAYAEEEAVSSSLGDKAKELGIEVTRPTVQQKTQEVKEEKKKEEKKEEEKKEVDVGEGLSGLFGM